MSRYQTTITRDGVQTARTVLPPFRGLLLHPHLLPLHDTTTTNNNINRHNNIHHPYSHPRLQAQAAVPRHPRHHHPSPSQTTGPPTPTKATPSSTPVTRPPNHNPNPNNRRRRKKKPTPPPLVRCVASQVIRGRRPPVGAFRESIHLQDKRVLHFYGVFHVHTIGFLGFISFHGL